MQLLKVEAHNVKRVTDVTLDLSGHHLFVIGGHNGAGKSSVLDSVIYAMCGKKAIPKMPLKTGQEQGSVRLEITGDPDVPDQQKLVVTRHFSSDGTTSVEISNEDGYLAPRPQDMLNDLYGRIGFDPLEFTRLKPKDQLEELKQVVGLDFAAIDQEYQTVYATRTARNKEVKDLESSLKLMPHFAEAPETEQDMSAVQEEITRITEFNKARDEIVRRNDERERAKHALELEIEAQDNMVSRLEQELEAAKAKRATLQGDRNQAAIPDYVPEEQSMDTAFQKQAEIEDSNTQVRANNAHKEKSIILDAKQKQSKELTERLKDLLSKKEQEMSAATWPVEGLGFGDGGVTLNGLPFEQASSAEQLRVAVAMGMAANPKLKVLIIRDGSLLDDESLGVLNSIVEAKGYQLLVEVVTRSDGDESRCHVVIADGRVKTRGVNLHEETKHNGPS